MHERYNQSHISVPKVRMTTHLKKKNFEINNNQNGLQLYRYQHIPEKVTSVKRKVPILFTSGSRLVYVYLYQIIL